MKAKNYRQPPSKLLGVTNKLAAYNLDSAVLFFGVAMDNALQERINIGTDERPEYRPRYRLQELLSPTFRFPEEEDDDLESLFGADGVRMDEV